MRYLLRRADGNVFTHGWKPGFARCPTQEGHASGSFPTGLPTVNHQSNKNQRGRPTVHKHRQSQLPRILRHMSSSAASSSRPGQPGAQYGRPFRSDPNRDEHRVPAALLDGPSPADLTSPPVGAFPCWMETVKRVHRCAGGVFAPTGLFRPLVAPQGRQLSRLPERSPGLVRAASRATGADCRRRDGRAGVRGWLEAEPRGRKRCAASVPRRAAGGGCGDQLGGCGPLRHHT